MTRRGALPGSRRRLAVGVVATALVVGAAAACTSAASPVAPDRPATTSPASGPSPGRSPTPTPTPTPSPPPRPAVFTILGAGDVLLHDAVTRSATHDGVVDYSTELSGLDAWVRGADLAICHLETPIVPPGEQVTTYPAFGVPPEIVRDLAEEGWDGCSTASNHSLDRGLPGVVATLDAFDAAGLGHAGTARSAAEAAPQLYRLVRAGRTLTVAHLSMTYGLNGFTLPAHAPWAVQLVDVDAVVAQARAARAAGADVVVVSLHDGAEYRTEPTTEQVDVATQLAASGVVDLVLGHHAHVPQRAERLPGGPGGTGMWVAYGLGNMLSNQGAACCSAAASSGVMVTATVVARPHRPARVTQLEWNGITVDRGAGHRARVLADAIADPGSGTVPLAELQAREQRARDAVGTAIPERTTPPTPTGPAPVVVPRPR